jgi:O-antigen ligase
MNQRVQSTGKIFFGLSGLFLLCLVMAIYSGWYWLAAIPFGILFMVFGWQQIQPVFFLLVLSLPWSIEFLFTNSLGTDLPDEPLMLVTAGLFACLFFFKPLETMAGWKHLLIFLLLADFSWMVITIFFSTDWLVSLKYVAAKSWYLCAFVFLPLVLFKERKNIIRTALLFLFSMLAFTVFAMYRHEQLGFTFAHINDAVQPFFRNHVNYSAMLVCTVPVLTAIAQLKKKSRWWIAAILLFVLAALFLSYARGAWLALVIGAGTYWLMLKRKLFLSFLIVIGISLLAVSWLRSNDRYLDYAHDFRTTIFHEDFQEHLVATYQLKDVSTAERFNRWIAGARMVGDRWLTGYGPNAFYENYKPYEIPAFKTWVSNNKDHSTVHNYFLLTLIEQGVPGLLLFISLLAAMIFYAEKIYRQARDQFTRVTAMSCGVMLSMIITVNFLSDLVETDKVGSLFFLVLATLVAIDRQNSLR